MKKQYLEPTTIIVAMKGMHLMAGSGELTGTGIDIDIHDSSVSGEADSRRGNIWDD